MQKTELQPGSSVKGAQGAALGAGVGGWGGLRKVHPGGQLDTGHGGCQPHRFRAELGDSLLHKDEFDRRPDHPSNCGGRLNLWQSLNFNYCLIQRKQNK